MLHAFLIVSIRNSEREIPRKLPSQFFNEPSSDTGDKDGDAKKPPKEPFVFDLRPALPHLAGTCAERGGLSVLVTSATDGLAFAFGGLTSLPALK
jgi:hypothetical protein